MKSAPDVIGALTVTSRASATAALRELTARHRGRIIASRDESDATVVDVRLPRDQYAAFVAGLGAVGRWRAERETADLPAEVGISVRLVP